MDKKKFKRQANALKQTIRERVQDAAAEGSHINVAGRVNKAVVVNTGKKGERHHASSTQNVRIVQDGKTTVEHVETVTDEA